MYGRAPPPSPSCHVSGTLSSRLAGQTGAWWNINFPLAGRKLYTQVSYIRTQLPYVYSQLSFIHSQLAYILYVRWWRSLCAMPGEFVCRVAGKISVCPCCRHQAGMSGAVCVWRVEGWRWRKNIPARLGGAGRGCRMWCDVSLFVFEHRIPSGQLYRVESGELEYVLWDIFLVHYKSEQVFVQPLVGHNQMPLEA